MRYVEVKHSASDPDSNIIYGSNSKVTITKSKETWPAAKYMQGVPGGKDNILGGHSIGHSKQKTLYEHVSNSERFPR
jgi:hypothetical protein